MMSASGEGATPSPLPPSSSTAGGGSGATNKSDTSSRAAAAPVKNPLLSMQVTGLTLDDFAHHALLLPAAPPPPPPKEPTPPPLLEVSRESETTDIRKPIVFGGAVPELQDPDSFSEIDLHSTADSLSNAPPSTNEYNPLLDLEDSEQREPNSYLQQTSALTAQFAAQLPNVASTVFSTFSRVIKGTSPGPQQPLSQSLAVEQPSFPPPVVAYDYSQPERYIQDSNSYLAQQQQQGPPPPPPTFFNPEAISQSGPAHPPPATAAGSNTYRLGGAKKKTYAHIPGLSTAGPPPTVVAPVQAQDLSHFAPPPEVTSEAASRDQSQKPGFSFFEKLPNLLEKIPKPAFTGSQQPSVPPNPTNYFGGPTVQPSVSEPLVTPSNPPNYFGGQSVPQHPPLEVSPFAQSLPSQPTLESLDPPTSLPPPPTFFTPAQIPSVPNLPHHQPSKNPYSSSHLNRSSGLYKNALSSTTPATIPTFLPNQEPPKISSPTNFFQPPSFEAQPAPPPVQFFNPQPVPIPVEHPTSIFPATTVDPIVSSSSRPQSSLSESLTRKSSLFAPFEKDPESINKTVLDSRSKSSENVLSPPPRPNSNLSEPALFSSEGQPLSLFNPEALSSPTPPAPQVPVGFLQPQQPQHQPIDTVNFFNPSLVAQAPPELPPPPSIASLGSKPYNLQKTKRPTYAVPPSLTNSSTVPLPAPLNQFTVPVPPTQLFNPVAADPFDLTAPQLQQQQPPPNQAQPVSFFNNNNIVDSTATTYFNPVAVAPPQDLNANSGPQPTLFSPQPTQQLEPQRPPSAVSQFFSSAPNDINANFANLQISPPKPKEPLTNPSDFFNTDLSPAQPSVATTGQSQSQVKLFSFFGQPPAIEPANVPATAPVLYPQDSVDQASLSLEDSPSKGTDGSDDQQLIQVIEPEPVDQSNAVNDSQLDDRYDDPSEQERIGNAPEPIFSSDNLFEFKKSAFEDDTYSKDVLIDANSSSMAAMTATAVPPSNSAIVDSSMASITEASTNIAYRPIYRHWFFKREIESKVIWTPFSMSDSLALEDALPLIRNEDADDTAEPSSPVIVHVDGGRHDVMVKDRKMTPVYWKGASQEVRRCSWFYKNVDSRYVPYDEEVAELLEREYKEAATSGEWHRRVVVPNGETVVFHGPSVIVHFLQTQNPDAWGGSSPVPPTTNRPRIVKRGVDEFNIEDGEPERVDHLLFMVHGIGEACDLRFRPVEEVVDEFRSISAQLVQSHYRSSFDRGDIGRVEVLPISWHNDLHSEESGVDKKLKAITLESIPKLRNFTNDTVLDVLFYTSPMFCQNIIDAVGNSLNRLYALFLERNPSFKGGVSLAGHSLGSLILFDLLCHQKGTPMETENSNPDLSPFLSTHPTPRPLAHKCCQQQINYEVGPAGTGQPYIAYPQLLFNPKKFFALGSPIGMFVTVRGIDTLGLDFKLPTCEGFFNIFHPYDPVAYRIEALVNPDLSTLRPVLIPHHKGRKRMHLELKETMLRVGTDLKQKVLDTFRNTLDAVYSITSMHRPDRKAIECEVDKVLEDQLKFETGSSSSTSDLDTGETDLPLGKLNQTRRIDYVLQEAPLEFFNEYLFALTSHVCYWESEDTMLFLMKEIYSSMGVQSDSQIPQQSMTIERPRVVSPTPAGSAAAVNFNLYPQQPTTSGTVTGMPGATGR
ncbi:mucin-5AC isoform X2 [Aedes albopictus]|uniref:DDHD domain-containing protein n=1 Tax=Aedes albopictus TaxID=7160 RepID=A0ABM1ZSW9_AEDAL